MIFDLCTGRYQLYKKPNDTPKYINVSSNDTHNIFKAVPDNFSNAISKILYNKSTFDKSSIYQSIYLSIHNIYVAVS